MGEFVEIALGVELIEHIQSGNIAGIGELAGGLLIVFHTDILRNQLLVEAGDVVAGSPGILVTKGQRSNAIALEGLAEGQELIPSGGSGQTVLIEDLLIVNKELAVQTQRNTIVLAIRAEGLQAGFHQGASPGAVVSVQSLGQIHNSTGSNELSGELTAPGEEHVGAVVRTHHNSQLILNRLVGNSFRNDGDVGMLFHVGGNDLIKICNVFRLRPFVEELQGNLLSRSLGRGSRRIAAAAGSSGRRSSAAGRKRPDPRSLSMREAGISVFSFVVILLSFCFMM